jgi:uncharacterized membrane protein YhaH (DUF805 family)
VTVTRTVRTGIFGLGVVGLLVLIAMASRGTHPTIGGHVSNRPVPNSVQDGFITLLATAYAVVTAGIAVALFRYNRRWHDRKSRWLANFAFLLALMLVATVAGFYGTRHVRLHTGFLEGLQRHAGGRRSAPARPPALGRPGPARTAHFQWPLVFGVVGLLVLGGAWVYVRRARETGPDGEQTLEAAIISTVETTIEDLRNEADPRRAVIAAYAQMEGTLASHGLRRDAAETPLEYLARILERLNVRDGAVRTLTGLFEYAKFSSHEIDARMREDAIDALLAIRDDLQRQEGIAA